MDSSLYCCRVYIALSIQRYYALLVTPLQLRVTKDNQFRGPNLICQQQSVISNFRIFYSVMSNFCISLDAKKRANVSMCMVRIKFADCLSLSK